MNDAVQAAVDAAMAQANQAAPEQPSNQEIAQAQPAATPATAPGRPRKLSDVVQNATGLVDAYLSVNEMGVWIGTEKKDCKDYVDVKFRLSDIKPIYAVRYNVGGGTQFAKSLDGVITERSGEPWATTVAKARQIDDRCKGAYDSLSMTMELVEDFLAKDGKTIVAKAGSKVGHDTAVTGTAPVMSFLQDLYSKGVDENDVLLVRMHGKARKKGSYDWGVFEPELLSQKA